MLSNANLKNCYLSLKGQEYERKDKMEENPKTISKTEVITVSQKVNSVTTHTKNIWPGMVIVAPASKKIARIGPARALTLNANSAKPMAKRNFQAT